MRLAIIFFLKKKTSVRKLTNTLFCRFVLDCGNANPTIYVWNGPKSTLAKKSKGSAVAEIFKNHERSGHATIVKIEGADDASFWAALGGGSANDVQDKWALGSDEYPLINISNVFIS
jgi:hypothetical protein